MQYNAFDFIEPRELDYVTFLSDGLAFIAVGAGMEGKYPLLYCSNDGGISWTECTLPSDQQGPCVQIERIERINGRLEITCSALAEDAVSGTYISDDGLVWSL